MKKIVSLMMAVILTLGMVSGAAAASGKITGVRREITTKDYTDMTATPGKVIELPLTADIFEWSNGTGKDDEPVTESQLKSGSITMKPTYSKSKSKNVVEKISIESKKLDQTNNAKCAYIRVEFVEEYKGSDEFEFDFTVYLYHKGNRVSDSGVTFSGTFGRPVLYIDGDQDYVDLSGGEVAEPEEYIRNIECYLGNGMYITTKMFEDKRYYGTVKTGVTSADADILDAYPEIDNIYTVTTNLSGKVSFDVDDKYYLYDTDGRYIGTTDDEDIKLSKKYYLASEKIDLSSSSSSRDDDDDDDDTIPLDDDDDYDYVPPSSGGSSVNDNPETGLGRTLTASVVMISLSSLMLLALNAKKRS